MQTKNIIGLLFLLGIGLFLLPDYGFSQNRLERQDLEPHNFYLLAKIKDFSSDVWQKVKGFFQEENFKNISSLFDVFKRESLQEKPGTPDQELASLKKELNLLKEKEPYIKELIKERDIYNVYQSITGKETIKEVLRLDEDSLTQIETRLLNLESQLKNLSNNLNQYSLTQNALRSHLYPGFYLSFRSSTKRNLLQPSPEHQG